MKKNMIMTKRIFYIIVALCGVIIMINSIETLIKSKDIDLFNIWLTNPKLNVDLGQTKEELYAIYLSMCLSTFLMKVITPMGLAINSYFSLKKTGINNLFVAIWLILITGVFGFSIIGESMYSIFFILNALCNLTLIIIMIYLAKELKNKKIALTYR